MAVYIPKSQQYMTEPFKDPENKTAQWNQKTIDLHWLNAEMCFLKMTIIEIC